MSDTALQLHDDGQSRFFDMHARIAPLARDHATASMTPEHYRDNPGNCHIAVELASRLNAPVLWVMQNLYIVKGKPLWSGQAVIALVNTCGRFSPLRWRYSEGKHGRQCVAYCTDLRTGDVLEGTPITERMVKAEKWGTKWTTMPDQMYAYRSAVFFARMYCPEIMFGMTVDEAIDVYGSEYDQPASWAAPSVAPSVAPDVAAARVDRYRKDAYKKVEDEIITALHECAQPDGVRSLFERGKATAREYSIEKTPRLNDAFRGALARVAESGE